jgi:hypothetical protein
MRISYLSLLSLAIIALGVGMFPASAQVPVKKVEANAKPLPLMSNGKPDLSGIWLGGVGLIKGRGWNGDGPGEPPPYLASVLPKVQAMANDNNADPEVHCFMLGTPRVTAWPFPFKIIQSPKEVVILYESMRIFRDIPTDGRGHRAELDETYMGDSVGHWEGKTLVVDVIGFNDKTYIAGVGTIHSNQMHVVERYTPTADGRIQYEALVEDPKVFKEPWKVLDGIFDHPVGDDMIAEYECLDGYSRDLGRLVGK